MAPLPECLPLDPISLGNLKYPRPGELKRVLGVPGTSEDRAFGVANPKARAPVGNELRLIKETVEDVSKEARDRAKMFHESMSRLDKYRETLTSKKRQRGDSLPGAQLVKAGIKIQQSPHDIVTQRLESKAKNGALNKRARTSMADQRTVNRPVTPSRQQMFPDKDGNTIQVIGGISGRVEEKTRRLVVGGEGLDQKIKKKRSVGAMGSNRVLNGDRDVKRPEPLKPAGDSKLRSCDSHSFRLKSSLASGISKLDSSFEPTTSDSSPLPKTEREIGSLPSDRVAVSDHSILVKGSNRPNIQQKNLMGSLQTVIKGKVSKAQRTSSVMALDSSINTHPSSGAFQGSEHPTHINKGEGTVNLKLQTSGSSAIHPMTQWGGQRPHKNSRTRRTNLVSPVSNVAESQLSSTGFATFGFGARACFLGTAGSTLLSNVDNNDSPKVISETENVPTPYGLSESEESGAGENKLQERRIDCGEASVTASQKVGAFVSPMKKYNKISANESGDGLKKQGKIARGSLAPPVVPPKEKSKKVLTTTEPLQDIAPSDKAKRLGKTGRPPSKKLKDRKGFPRFRPALSNGSSDFTGESDDDHEELYSAAKSARNSSSQACSSVFWKKMDHIFASVRSEDASYLNHQISVAEEMGDSLSQMFGDGLHILGLDVGFSSSGATQDGQCEKLDSKRFGKVTPPLYQRVLSAFIEEDENEEFYHHTDGRNHTSLQSVSDDSHCGSSNQFDIEPKDKDRVESEVESNQGFQTQQRNGFLERLSCDDSSPSMIGSLHSNGRWLGCNNEFSHSEVGHAGEISSNHFGRLLQSRELDVPEFPPSECQYQLMSVDDKVLLELHSIGLFPESLPHLADGGEMITGDIIELKNELHKTVARKKKQLGKIDKAVQKGRDIERRNIEQVAMDKLLERAYRKRMACRGGNASKSVVRKVSKQVAMAFLKRTLARYQKFEVTGKSCFTDPMLQDILFSAPPSNGGSKFTDYIGSGTASNTCNEASEQVSYKYGSTLNRGSKKREALIDDVVGSASSRVTSAFNSTTTCVVEAKGKTSDRDSLRNNSPSGGGGGQSSLDSSGTLPKTKGKLKQKTTQSTDPSGGSSHRKSNEAPLAEQPGLNLGDNLQLNELGSLEELSGNQDLSSWLNFEEDEYLDQDLIGLEIPDDDLADLNMLM